MNRKMQEYNRGRDQGLDMAWRMCRDAGYTEAAALIAEEIRFRGKVPVKLSVTSKEIQEGLESMRFCMYETFLCMSVMVLHDQFGFGKKRIMDFLGRWSMKTGCMSEGLVNWADMIQAVRDELGIDLPTEWMRKEGLIA